MNREPRYISHMPDETEYTEQGFWEKLNTTAKKAGSDVVEKALQLYYAADAPTTPTWAKGVIFGALAYLIAPLDGIPDPIPFAGFSDDLGVLIVAISTVAFHITPEVNHPRINDVGLSLPHLPVLAPPMGGDTWYEARLEGS